jgi:hypothetical protein
MEEQKFVSSIFYRLYLCGLIYGPLSGGVIFVLVCIFALLNGKLDTAHIAGNVAWPAFAVAAAVIVIFPGRLLAMFPYAVEIMPTRGVRLVALGTTVWVPVENIYEIEHSDLWRGDVIRFKRKHNLLTQCVIFRWFGSERDLFMESLHKLLADGCAQ